MPLASPGYIFRTSAVPGEHFIRPTQQHLLVMNTATGELQYFPLEDSDYLRRSMQPLGSFSLLGAVITQLDGASCAIQVKMDGGDVAHIDAADEAERDRWCLEINVAGLRAASGRLHSCSREASPPNPVSPPQLVTPAPRGSTLFASPSPLLGRTWLPTDADAFSPLASTLPPAPHNWGAAASCIVSGKRSAATIDDAPSPAAHAMKGAPASLACARMAFA